MSATTAAPESADLASVLEEAKSRLDPNRRKPSAFLPAVYHSLVELAEKQLEEVAEGEGDAAWTFRVLQELIPALRDASGISLDDPECEYEKALRERYGVEAPAV